MADTKKVIRGLECCSGLTIGCAACPYCDEGNLTVCSKKLTADARERITALMLYAPPVFPGMTIFPVVYDEDTDLFVVEESEVAQIWYNQNGWFFTEKGHIGHANSQRQMGESIFLTREAAQEKCNLCNKERHPRSFNTRLKMIREELGISQNEFSKRLGISRVSLTHYEAGDRTPDIDFLKRLHQETGVSLYYLLGLSDKKEGAGDNE